MEGKNEASRSSFKIKQSDKKLPAPTSLRESLVPVRGVREPSQGQCHMIAVLKTLQACLPVLSGWKVKSEYGCFTPVPSLLLHPPILLPHLLQQLRQPSSSELATLSQRRHSALPTPQSARPQSPLPWPNYAHITCTLLPEHRFQCPTSCVMSKLYAPWGQESCPLCSSSFLNPQDPAQYRGPQ